MDERRMVPVADPDLDDLRRTVDVCNAKLYQNYLRDGILFTVTRQPEHFDIDPIAFNPVLLPSGNVQLLPWRLEQK